MRNVFVDFELGYGIAAAPKTGTLSIVAFMFEMRYGHAPAPGEVDHGMDQVNMGHPASGGFQAGLAMIAVHRDPYERIRSAYQHRVIREREAPARSFRAFCDRLGYFRGYRPIAWHTDSQTQWLGDQPERYSAIVTLDRLDTLPAVVSALTGRPAPAMTHTHRMPEKPAWEDGLKESLDPWVAGDLRAGWDGVTMRGPASVPRI
jgi:hypothetical protein